jgi:phthalate 4,5-dioxygenase oxygenase subunit
MLRQEENDLLCRVGPGAPMGELFRRFWIPAMLPSELPEADCAPVRLRLLSENLVAYRDTNGTIGVVAENCPHRGASLFFGRNEEAGLRCVYHGWKFDSSGSCVDMPNEPPESNFKRKVKVTAYPCVEKAGIVWAYMGTRETPPDMPDMEWMNVPENHRRIAWRAIRQCNWVQAMEGDLDTSHAYFLHGRVDPNGPPEDGFWHQDKAPRLFVMDTDYGVMYGSRRDEGREHHYWRTSQFLFPCTTMFPASPEGTIPGHYWVPIDDYSTLIWCFCWNPATAYTEDELRGYSSHGEINELWAPNNGHGDFLPTQHGKPYADSYSVLNASNDYGIDREVQRTRTFTGIPHIPLQDVAVTETMGRVSDRSVEHLGTSDAMIIRVRRRLIQAVKALRDQGVTPPGVTNPEVFHVRSCAAVLPANVDWAAELRDWHEGRINTPLPTAVKTDRPAPAS